MHQEVRPFPAEDAWERLLPSCRNMCTKDASQGQREKSLVLSVGRIHTQTYREMFLYILTNIARGEKKDYWAGMRSKDEACCWREQFSSWRSHTNRRDLSPRAEVTMSGHFVQNLLLQQSRFPFPLGLQQEAPNPDSAGFKGTILLLKSHHSPSGHGLLKHWTLTLICWASSFPNLSWTWKPASW